MKTNRVLSLLLVLVIIGSGFIMPVSAYENNDELDTCLCAEHFETMTREEYIQGIAATNNISFEEAEQQVDSDIEEALAKIPSTLSWIGDTTVSNGDTTYTVYGRVTQKYEDASGMTVTYQVQAVLIKSVYGSTWASCNSTGTTVPGSGGYTFSGSCEASIISNRQLRMTLTGYFEVSTSLAHQLSFDLELFQYSHSIGNDQYYRRSVYDSKIEVTSVQGG